MLYESFFIIHELVKRNYTANMMQNFILWQKQQQIVLLHQEAWSVVMPKITNNQLYQTRLGRKKRKIKDR